MDNETDSNSEEEILVFAEFGDSVNIDKYRSIHVLGINQRNPIIQMDETFFTGKFEQPLGTYMFFEDNPMAESCDPIFDKLSEKNLKYVCKTQKYLSMEHAYVSSKEGAEQNMQNQESQPDDEIQVVNFKSLQEALQRFQSISHDESKSISTTSEQADTSS
ncbi:general transcription factor 3C polypeptide 6-like isoform X2 [Achroia grisella]|uniref:general transcription factor 3C polypeptide 6-like isoform X2 n=1 Tax=Achroia grisella TaxID=688607 RepID=UPI0027D28A7E|nr:general transcription factor 3C polypeptide 6-like isoform X2 [Achroia grisella]XP_059061213.1 general transcription factor 3C polypeptide 6-like isoform X2 [Achroia grisella]